MRKIYALLFTVVLFVSAGVKAQSIGNYSFSTNATASLTDMSSGTTELSLASATLPNSVYHDDDASVVTNLPFTFYFMGVSYDRFSVNSNGQMKLGNATDNTAIGGGAITSPSLSTALLCPFTGDNAIQATGKVHYKSTGFAPNRVFIFEWKDFRVPFSSTPATGGTMQVRLYETTGVVEFVYGIMYNNSTSAQIRSVAIASSNTATTSTYIATITATPINTASATWATTSFGASASLINLNGASDGSRRIFSYTPPVPAAATNLTFTNVGLTTTTLNWTDNSSNEVGFLIERSTDGGTTYSTVTTTAANTTTYAATGLQAAQNYFWRVTPISEGALGTALVNNQTTSSCPSFAANIDINGAAAVTGTSYPTLTAAIADLKACSISQATTLRLTSGYTPASETYPITLSSITGASSTNTITIVEASGVSGKIITSSNTTATIDINGGNYWIIDGRSGGTGTTKDLQVINTSTSGSAIRIINEGSNNTVKYCDIRGVNTSTGVINILGTTGANGNDNITIDNCDIRDGATTPTNGVYSLGQSSSATNDNITVSNCNIFNYFNAASSSAGINISSFNSGWSVTTSHFYQTATRTTTAGSQHNGIVISNSGIGYTISGNFIGGSTTSCGGTAWTYSGSFANRFVGINVSALSTATTSIQGNTIANFSITLSTSATTSNGIFSGIWVSGGNVNIGTITGNTIGSITGTGSITITNSTTSGTANIISYSGTGIVDIRNNIIGSINLLGSTTSIGVGINGILVSGGTPTIRNNTIGSASTANSINSSTVVTAAIVQSMMGIQVTSGVTTTNDITSNTIANINQAGTSTGSLVRGISYAGTGVATINSNTIYNLSGANANTSLTGGAASVLGILYTGSSTGSGAQVNNNTVYTLSATNTGAVQSNVIGISLANPTTPTANANKVYDLRNASTMATATTPPLVIGIGTRGFTTSATISNNMISLGTSQTTNTEFVGIIHNLITAATLNFYHNSVIISGTASSGALPSFAFLRGDNSGTAVTSTVNLRNNIFINNRTGGTGKHYAIANQSTTVSTTGWGSTASNFNVLNSTTSGTLGLWGSTDLTFATWKSTTSCDNNSLNGITVTFTDAANGDLHLNMGTTPTQLESGSAATGVTSITTDFDGQVRPGPAGSANGGAIAPDFGADEFDGVMLDLVAPTITYTNLTNLSSTANRTLTGFATITDASNVNTTSGTRPRIYYKRTTDGNVFNDNTNGTDGWKWQEATNTISPFSFVIDYSLLNGGTGVSAGNVIQYFVTAQDIATTPNIGINSGTFAATPSSVALTSAAFPIGGTINSYNIATSFSGNYNVPGAFPTLTGVGGFFAAINAGVVGGNVTVTITGNLTEDGTNALNQWSEEGAGNYTMTIQPDAASIRTISGDVAAGMIRLNGADRVTVDGRFGGSGIYLNFINTNAVATGTGSVFTFINGATNNILQNVFIQSTTNSTNAPVLFSTTTSVGNSNNTVTGCKIRAYDGTNNGNICLYSAGTVGFENSTNSISNNEMYSFGFRALDIASTGSTGWTISGNSIYSELNISYTTAPSIQGIRVQGGNGYTITNNLIGGSAANNGGSNITYSSTTVAVTYTGIQAAFSAGTLSNIKGNIIKKVNVNCVPTAANTVVFYGINITAGTANIGGSGVGEGNTIGSNTDNSNFIITTTTGTSTFTSQVWGIGNSGTGNLIQANQVGGFDINNLGAAPSATTVYGIVNLGTATTPPMVITSNIIGSNGVGAASNSIRFLSTSISTAPAIIGITHQTSINAVSVTNNYIRNITNQSTTSSGGFTGVLLTSSITNAVIVSGNTIDNIGSVTNASGIGSYTGISSA